MISEMRMRLAYADGADFRLEGGSIIYRNAPVLRMADTKLRGSHNIENLMATMAVGLARGLTFEQMLPPLCAYEPRPHRCAVRQLGGRRGEPDCPDDSRRLHVL